jgi:hypothetical protein
MFLSLFLLLAPPTTYDEAYAAAVKEHKSLLILVDSEIPLPNSDKYLSVKVAKLEGYQSKSAVWCYPDGAALYHQRTILNATAVHLEFKEPEQIGRPVEALDEVNAYRARRGLRPFCYDQGLTDAALACAQHRAERLCFGHTHNDFSFCRVSCSAAGCAAYHKSYGWMSCCADENYTYAGAAYCTGSDGKRYMHLFVR